MNNFDEAPNLFKHARKELSQDSVIAWIISWSRTGYRHIASNDFDLYITSQNLLKEFLSLHGINSDTVQVDRIETQYNKIDIFIVLKIDSGDSIAIIIEDKTHTSYHSGQLEKYYEYIEEKKIKSGYDRIVGIYLKTGTIFDKDTRLPNPYKLYTLEMLRECLKSVHTNNIILKEYIAYLDYIYEEAEREKNNIKTHAGQRAFAIDLMRNIAGREVYGNNRDGTPFYQIWIDALERKFKCGNEEQNEGFFYRIDKRNNESYISLRRICNYGNKTNDYSGTIAVKRLKYYRDKFDKVFNT